MLSTISYKFGELTLQNWEAAGLLKPSVVKPVIITFEKHLVLNHLGHLTKNDQAHLTPLLQEILGN